ncbi:hypothetical protein F8S09_12800 [Deinococcus sp. SDU3-2]|uniref:Peripheral subunit-binding (PSBD) domain-containing protein n=1 Tax=Deinococcus terrestris TaxID=2651870 RepID=A0A7X1NXE0_9DEIO|nr:E3 binding domain-containing protein [Deinococcus terrestris]MPY67553.1 hypothetical protein [Deinococcus terrestris]
MERIAPLAKILAEANGIEWQHLDGSGEGGMIVEQDILNYLTRIMSGEEEPPATPVDAPPPEWTGTELPPGGGLLAPGMPSMDMLSSAGVDSDLAALVGQPAPVSPMPAPEASLPEVSLEDEAMEFELEDEPETVAPAPEPAPFAAASEPVDVTPVTPAIPMPSFSGPVPTPAAASEPVTPEPAAPAAAAAATGGVMGGLGGLLSRLYQKPSQDPAPVTPAPPELQPTAPAFTPAPVSPFSAPVAEAAPAEPTPVAPTFTPTPQPEATPEPEAIPAPLPEVAAPEVVEELAAEPLAEPAPLPTAPVQPEPTEIEPTAQPEAQPELQPVPTLIPAAPVREAVWFGPYLRRDGNVAPTLELCRQLAGALGQDVPLALLVARAAQRHAEMLELGTVGVYRVGGEQARPVQSGSLREALAALDGDFAGTPDLLVTDAGALDLDELHLPHALTLSVGRVQDGRTALTLNGPVDPAQGARFLASVAATLEEPIILVI